MVNDSYSRRDLRTRISREEWSSARYGKISAEREGSSDSNISFACLRDESFTARSPWLLAAARRESACCVRAVEAADDAIAEFEICFAELSKGVW